MEVFSCTKLFFNILGNGSNFGCFGAKSGFSAAFVRLRIVKLIPLAYPRLVFTCLNVNVLMGVYVLL